MRKELTRIFTAQITAIVKDNVDAVKPKEEEAKELAKDLKEMLDADDVTVTAQDFIMEEGNEED